MKPFENRPVVAWLGEAPGHEDKAPILVRREGNRIFIREKDPNEPTPPRIPVYEDDEVVPMLALSHTGVNTSDEVGDTSGLIVALRIVPTRHEPGMVYARTLRRDEEDDGRRVHVAPGEQVTLENITVELEYFDDLQEPTASGYVPLTPSLWSWLSIAEKDDAKFRYLLAASRRLDQANELLIAVEQHREKVNELGDFGPAFRPHLFALIGAVETAVVTLSRAVDMATQVAARFGTVADLPASVSELRSSVVEIRNAYEHIEDRAFGTVRGRPNDSALTIFNHQTLLSENAIVYGEHRLSLDVDLPRLLADTRAYLKMVAGGERTPEAGSS
ncbi:light-mediated development protein DET1 [Arthrobacter sp. NamB2]|uniref:light-mediated development protein DET1 n=1 Tax=Arthrobacter sp. NamB2 TaxID=2576035 RepID=UPI0010C9536B|nr:light-mediated development protein DET1 [Arthrobacter sp. NamB2]TKV26156.1 light-mediated development protein DET1 [Arthrobacter sp. NamB2]